MENLRRKTIQIVYTEYLNSCRCLALWLPSISNHLHTLQTSVHWLSSQHTVGDRTVKDPLRLAFVHQSPKIVLYVPLTIYLNQLVN